MATKIQKHYPDNIGFSDYEILFKFENDSNNFSITMETKKFELWRIAPTSYVLYMYKITAFSSIFKNNKVQFLFDSEYGAFKTLHELTNMFYEASIDHSPIFFPNANVTSDQIIPDIPLNKCDILKLMIYKYDKRIHNYINKNKSHKLVFFECPIQDNLSQYFVIPKNIFKDQLCSINDVRDMNITNIPDIRVTISY